jgi:hypothetical protein
VNSVETPEQENGIHTADVFKRRKTLQPPTRSEFFRLLQAE